MMCAIVGGRRFSVVVLGPAQYATAMNNRGHLVGRVLDPVEGTRGVLHDVHGSIALGTLGGSFSAARDINDDGVIVGDSLLAGDDVHHGFLYVSGVLFDLNDLLEEGAAAYEILHALSINNLNEIVTIAIMGGEERTVLLRPR